MSESGGEKASTSDSEAIDDLANDIPREDPGAARQQPQLRSNLKDHALDMTLVIGTLAIDGMFIVGAGALNWAAHAAMEHVALEGLSAAVIWWVQLLLAASTLGAVGIRVVADLLVMLKRAVRQVSRG